MTSTAAELVATIEATAVKAAPAVPEVAMDLYRQAFDNHRNQYRGRTDVKGTVRIRVYIGGEADEHKGEILAGTVKDITAAELTGKNDSLVLFEYRDTLAPNTLVLVWVPAQAEHKGVKVTL